MKKIIIQIIRNGFLILLILFLSLSLYSTNWATDTFKFLSFDEVLFQITTPIKGTASSILSSYLFDSLFLAIILTAFLFVVIYIILHFIDCYFFDFEIQIKKKIIHFKIKGFVFKICFAVCTIILTVGIVYYCLDKMLFIDYVKAQVDDSPFIEEHYVDPQTVSIAFPEQKRNLIFIYAESMESTFFSYDLGGESEFNYIEPLNDITANNITFSDTELFGGPITVNGSTWTSGAMVATTAGLPLKNSLDQISGVSSMLSGAYSLGNILDENGYTQEIMFGSDQEFGNRGAYFASHGNYKVYDYYEAIKNKKIDEDYFVWWGFEDSKLFEYAKEEITSLASQNQPFNFTMLTVNSHTKDGYVESDCTASFSSQYANAVYCSAEQIAAFIGWIQQQDFYSNTTVIVIGDHVSMQEDFYPEGTRRRPYNVFINSAVTEGNFKNRYFTSMDYFPTTLASLGVSIEGDRLGLGTNLFSNTPTLMEEVGVDYMVDEMPKYSTFYMKNFYYS